MKINTLEKIEEISKEYKLTPEQQQMVKDNYGLVISFLVKNNLSFEDNHSFACIGLCKAVELYNPAKGKLSTLAYLVMQRQCWKGLGNISQRKFDEKVLSLNQPKINLKDFSEISTLEESTESLLSSEENIEDCVGFITLIEVLKSFILLLNPLQKEIFLLKAEGYNYTEIGEKLNIDYNKINYLYGRIIIPKLKKHMKQCNYETKYLTIKIRNRKKENKNE